MPWKIDWLESFWTFKLLVLCSIFVSIQALNLNLIEIVEYIDERSRKLWILAKLSILKLKKLQKEFRGTIQYWNSFAITQESYPIIVAKLFSLWVFGCVDIFGCMLGTAWTTRCIPLQFFCWFRSIHRLMLNYFWLKWGVTRI